MYLFQGDNAELRELFRRNAVHRNDRRRAPVFAGFQIVSFIVALPVW